MSISPGDLITIAGLTGKLLRTENAEIAGEQSIDISSLAHGMYILQAGDGNRLKAVRFLKQQSTPSTTGSTDPIRHKKEAR